MHDIIMNNDRLCSGSSAIMIMWLNYDVRINDLYLSYQFGLEIYKVELFKILVKSIIDITLDILSQCILWSGKFITKYKKDTIWE